MKLLLLIFLRNPAFSFRKQIKMQEVLLLGYTKATFVDIHRKKEKKAAARCI